MARNTNSASPAVQYAGYYALLLSGATLCGLLVSSSDQNDHTVRMPVRVAGIVVVLVLNIIVGAGLIRRKNYARLLFFAIIPWSSIALGSALAPTLWPHDVPYTAALVIVYVPLVFLLTRVNALRAAHIERYTWISRGGLILGILCAVTLLLYVSVSMASMNHPNTKVVLEVLFLVPLIHFVPAIIAASIPTREGTAQLGSSSIESGEEAE